MIYATHMCLFSIYNNLPNLYLNVSLIHYKYLNCAFNKWYTKLHVFYFSIPKIYKNTNTFIYFFSLGFSVTIFCIEALLAIIILMCRRNPAVGGELGGPKIYKTISAGIFVFFWVFYVFVSALEAYEVIKPGF